MFYYPNVLQRHTGCFATIWLAATGAAKLMKREYLKVNVPLTCEEIMAFILVQVPPPMPGAPRPRFSLYLSSQLQFGVVRVYNRQCQYLMEEIQHILEHLNRARQQIRIDLTDLEQPGLLLPNQLAIMESLEEAPDPFFGMMEPVLPSPMSIPYVRSILETATPTRSPPERLPPSPWRPGELPITASSESITLKEAEPITLLKIEDERDLPEVTVREIDMLMEQEGFLVPGEEKPPQISSRKRRAEGESAEGVREQELLLSMGPSPPPRVGEEPSAVREVGELLTDEIQIPGEAPLLPLETTPVQERPRVLPSPPLTPLHPLLERRSPSSPELQLPPYEPSPLRPRKRRRQLRFLDPVTQISREDFQKQILDPQGQCQPLEMVLLPPKRLKTPEELFEAPSCGWMHPTLHGLWACCANLRRMDYARQREEERRKRREEEEGQRTEVPSELEELRAAEEPSVPPVGSSEISLETTEEEPRPSFVFPEERALQELEEAALPIVPELPEISFELPLDKNVITVDYVRRLIAAKLEEAGVTEFDQLLPRAVSRAVASRFFFTCLVLAAARFIHLKQAEPYGPIVVTPGARFHPG